MKKIIFLAFFASFSFFCKAQKSGYAGLLVEAVGKKIITKFGVYLKTNAQFLTTKAPYAFSGIVVPAYIKISDKSVEETGAEVIEQKIKAIKEKIMSQPLQDPYVCFVREMDNRHLKKIRKGDDAKVEVAFVIENFGSAITLQKFKEWQGGTVPIVPVQGTGSTNPYLKN